MLRGNIRGTDTLSNRHMSLDKPTRNKMMTAAPAKKEYHFAGNGIWHNRTILAETIEEATKLWLEQRELISTPARLEKAEEGVQ